jgi:hypothetical protein
MRVDLAELPRCLNRPNLSHVNSRNYATTLNGAFDFGIAGSLGVSLSKSLNHQQVKA